jgi:hypothetical protein
VSPYTPVHTNIDITSVISKPQKKSKPEIVSIPEWVPKESWEGFLEMRKAKRAKPTQRAIKLLLDKLERLRRDGHDPGAVLDQSTESNWTGIYQIKEPANGFGLSTPSKRTVAQKFNDWASTG